MRALWLALYALLCVAEFFVSWGKEYVTAKAKAPPPAVGGGEGGHGDE